AVDGSDILGIPALEAAPQAPHIWVYPPTKAADGILVNPVYPPEYRDFILVFPASSGVRPVYIVLNVPKDFKYHPAPVSLPAFPDVKPAPLKTSVRGGGKKRRRWKDASGKIYEWDSQHGKVEMYTKQGKHLGEYDPKTGEQTKPADSTRRVEK
ncbi:colicin E3/pyocin S6 family cytotoxin, partial [Pseudomonas sp.]|uniref:colicin E3/pyocin S6 family cytotoxin n=1 Tax=Pseudomonas sp. TaxID=306 RepID=UPI003BB730D8